MKSNDILHASTRHRRFMSVWLLVLMACLPSASRAQTIGVSDMGYLEPDFLTEAEKSAISHVTADEQPAKGTYSLSGQRINADQLHKGIYIMDGRKVIK